MAEESTIESKRNSLIIRIIIWVATSNIKLDISL